MSLRLVSPELSSWPHIRAEGCPLPALVSISAAVFHAPPTAHEAICSSPELFQLAVLWLPSSWRRHLSLCLSVVQLWLHSSGRWIRLGKMIPFTDGNAKEKSTLAPYRSLFSHLSQSMLPLCSCPPSHFLQWGHRCLVSWCSLTVILLKSYGALLHSQKESKWPLLPVLAGEIW